MFSPHTTVATSLMSGTRGHPRGSELLDWQAFFSVGWGNPAHESIEQKKARALTTYQSRMHAAQKRK